jgi:hypothetical protein
MENAQRRHTFLLADMALAAVGTLNGAGPVVPLGMIAIALLAIAITILATTSDPYDSIGGGVFDRWRGDDGERPPPEAEDDEFAAAIAVYCAREEARLSRRTSAPVCGRAASSMGSGRLRS